LGRGGDVDSDGYCELLVGAPYHDTGTFMNTGQARIYYGDSGGIETVANETLTGGGAQRLLGYSVGD
jgi:hypothetical protein